MVVSSTVYVGSWKLVETGIAITVECRLYRPLHRLRLTLTLHRTFSNIFMLHSGTATVSADSVTLTDHTRVGQQINSQFQATVTQQTRILL